MPAACEPVAGLRITFSLSSCLLVPGSWFLVPSQISHLKSHIKTLFPPCAVDLKIASTTLISRIPSSPGTKGG